MASLDRSMPPSTDCSALTSWGGTRSSGTRESEAAPKALVLNSAIDTAHLLLWTNDVCVVRVDQSPLTTGPRPARRLPANRWTTARPAHAMAPGDPQQAHCQQGRSKTVDNLCATPPPLVHSRGKTLWIARRCVLFH